MTEEKKGFDDALIRMKKRAEGIAAKKKAAQEAREAESRERANELAVVPIDITRYRNERNIMLYPLCSTSKRKRLVPIRYKSANGKYWLEVTANYTHGMVKIWDFDILRYALSKAGEIARETGYFPDYVEFSGYEVLKALGKDTKSGRNYRWVVEALRRMSFTGYQGNIFRTDDATVDNFTLISARYADRTGKLERIQIYFDERLKESARDNKGLLAIDSAVLHEESGMKKRILELIAVSKGKDKSWTVNLKRLQAMCAHEGELKKFKQQLRSYNLPWNISFTPIFEGGEKVTFFDR